MLISKSRGLYFVWYCIIEATQWYQVGNLNTLGIIKDLTLDLKIEHLANTVVFQQNNLSLKVRSLE